MEDLPIEMVSEILSHARSIADMASFSSVSKVWFDVVYSNTNLIKRLAKERYKVGILETPNVGLPGPHKWWHILRTMASARVLFLTTKAISNRVLEDLRQRMIAYGFRYVDTLEFNPIIATYNTEEIIKRTKEQASLISTYDVVVNFADGDWRYAGIVRPIIGDVLSDMVDRGCGVIQGVFSHCSLLENVGGRWDTGKYDPLFPLMAHLSGRHQLRGSHEMNEILIPEHFVMTNVKNITFHYTAPSGTLNPNAKVIANAKLDAPFAEQNYIIAPLVIELDCFKGRVMCLNYYLASTDGYFTGWGTNTDGGRLIANCIISCCPYKKLPCLA
mmetsp:Transcript_11939/g.13151  ORF Transcript_11939/g.13151 Transcript_11939/m.13151 type:complete len:330 (-) Transcript_11939:27-1016(-)